MSTCFHVNQNNKSLQSHETPWIFLCPLVFPDIVFPDKLQCSPFKDLFQCLVDRRTEAL